MSLTGRVVEELKNYHVVDCPAGPVQASTSGSLKKRGTKVCAGDIVDLKLIDSTQLRGIITAVHERSTFLRRPALANCSHLLCVCTYREPPLNLEALDRLLYTAEVNDLKPCVIVNKIDLLSAEELDGLAEIIRSYEAIGYPVLRTSGVTRAGVDLLVDSCTGRISACAGLSGVGKSTLLASIFPEVRFRIGALSDSSNRGTHTTTHVTLLPLPAGGYIADTPGLAYIDLPKVTEENVALFFPELRDCIGACRFNNCVHEYEPGCSVIRKVQEGMIAPWRHRHYLKIYKEMRSARKMYRNS